MLLASRVGAICGHCSERLGHSFTCGGCLRAICADCAEDIGSCTLPPGREMSLPPGRQLCAISRSGQMSACQSPSGHMTMMEIPTGYHKNVVGSPRAGQWDNTVVSSHGAIATVLSDKKLVRQLFLANHQDSYQLFAPWRMPHLQLTSDEHAFYWLRDDESIDVMLTDLRTRFQLHPVAGSEAIQCAAMDSPYGRVACGVYGAIRLFRLNKRRLIETCTIELPDADILWIGLEKNTLAVLSGRKRRPTISVFLLSKDGTSARRLFSHAMRVECKACDLSSDGTWVALADEKHDIHFFDMAYGGMETLDAHLAAITCLRFSTERTMISADSAGKVLIWVWNEQRWSSRWMEVVLKSPNDG